VTDRPLARWLPAIVVGLVAFIAARLAMLPGYAFWDTGELQAVAPLMGTGHAPGFPTYTLLGWFVSVILQPLGDPAFRMNLFAGVCLAVAVAVVVDLARVLSGSTAMGIVAGIGLTFTAWWIGTHAETHALHLALLAILFRLLVAWEDGRSDRTLVAAAFLYGVAIANHSLMLLLIPALGCFVVAVEPRILRRPRLLATCVAAVVIPLALIYTELPLRAGPFRAPLVYGTPNTMDGFLYIVLASQFQSDLSGPLTDLGPKLAGLLQRTVAAFGPLTLLLPFAFAAVVVRRPRYAVLSGVALLTTLLFAMSYTNGEIARYYLGPMLIAWTWVAILGGAVIDALVARGFRFALPTELRPIIAVAIAALLLAPTALAIPARYQAVDRSQDRSAEHWVDHVFAAMPQDSVIVSWWSYSTPLWYAQLVEGRRPDIAIIDDRTRLDENLGGITDVIDANLPTRPVYVIRADPREVQLLADRYVLDYVDGPDASMLTRVIGRRGAGA